MKLSESSSHWTIEDSAKLYSIHRWGNPYFSINTMGNVTVTLQDQPNHCCDLYDLISTLRSNHLNCPFLLRFPEILVDRLFRLKICFKQAINHYHYPNQYQGIYPIKCNPNRFVVESIVNSGKSNNFGLEVGSKSELMIALGSLNPDFADNVPLIICNGYKDSIYLQTVLFATYLGYQPIIVIEQLEELYLTVSISHQLGIEPRLGVRANLSTKSSGHWRNSTGDCAKFGLTIPQILTVVRYLESNQILHYLQLLHFHIGSQISAISVIKNAIREASQIYVHLSKINPNMKYLDVGGGLGVDYNGSKTDCDASKNYNMQNYANDIVAEVKEACESAKIKAPILMSESGRAITAHHSVLIFDVLNTRENSQGVGEAILEDDNLIIRNLWETYQLINLENYQEMYHDAIQFKEEAISLFNFGYLSLTERAKAEQLYFACCQKIYDLIHQQESLPCDLKNLEKIIASIYYTNLSIFRSVPDAWAINQQFPIMPIHRLHEEPTQRGILADITCDSDGKIDRFIDLENTKSVLELHPLKWSTNRKKEPYYLGTFLVGAYQEIMGNFHNLFGNVNTVDIIINDQGYHVKNLIKGETITDVLNQVNYNEDDLLNIIQQRIEQYEEDGQISEELSQKLLENYQAVLNSYPYLT